jgi:hypothetical protein
MEAIAQKINQDLSGKEVESGEGMNQATAGKLETLKRDGEGIGASQGRLDGLYLKGGRTSNRRYVKTSGRGEATYSGLVEEVEKELRDAKVKVERLEQKGILKRTLDEGERSDANEACQAAAISFSALTLTKEEFERLDGTFNALNDKVGEKSRKLNLCTGLDGVDLERTNRKRDGYEDRLARADAALPKEAARKLGQEKGTEEVEQDVVILNKGLTIVTNEEVWEQYYESVLH